MTLETSVQASDNGQFSLVVDAISNCPWNREANDRYHRLSRKLRAKSVPIALTLSHALLVRRRAFDAMDDITRLLQTNFVAFLGGKGAGKTFLSAELTKAKDSKPAGILLLANKLSKHGTIDDLVRRLPRTGTERFEELLEAVNAAGERAGIRIPVLIDGLNESDDPRVWRELLARIQPILRHLDHVVLAVTLRGYVSEQCLPESTETIDLSGFENCIEHAVAVYFDYYHISADHVQIPYKRFSSPLFLRFFCEATNPSRKDSVNVESVPTTVNEVYQKYLNSSIARIAERIRWREIDIANAIHTLASELWGSNTRTLPFDRVREILDEKPGPWDGTLTQALEQEGIVFRDQTREEKEESGITFDGFAGFCIAKAIVKDKDEPCLRAFCLSKQVQEKLSNDYQVCHPYARDIVSALAALIPTDYFGVNAWTMLLGDARKVALLEVASGERQYLDEGTLLELRSLARQENSLYGRLHETILKSDHPLNAGFLNETLSPMVLADRDLLWTEWLRRNAPALIADNARKLKLLRKSKEIPAAKAKLLLLWNKWLLTSTVHDLRDSATEIIVHIGKQHPSLVLDECLKCLSLNDQFVVSRLFTAAYGACLANQFLPLDFVNSLADFLKELTSKFPEDAYKPSFCHWEIRESIRDIVDFAIKFSIEIPGLLKEAHLSGGRRFELPFLALPDDVKKHAVGDQRLGSDFENYTIGGLFRDRRNYNYSHAPYSDTLTRIRKDARWLGLSRNEFSAIDDEIGRMKHNRFEKRPFTERYAKKYGWIAFYNEVGRLDSLGSLERGDRDSLGVPGPEIDPSFPQKPGPSPIVIPTWSQLGGNDKDEKWMNSQVIPLPDDLWRCDSLLGQNGQWVLAYGWLNSLCEKSQREVFGFVRTCLVPIGRESAFVDAIKARKYLGNSYLPEQPHDYCMYAAETSWSDRFENRDEWEYDSHYSGTVRSSTGISIPLEILTHRYQFEGQHSGSVVASGFSMPSRDFSRAFGLTATLSNLMQFDGSKRLASMTLSEPKGFSDGNLCYLREDLLRQYAKKKSCCIIQVAWGERNILRESLHDRERPNWLQQTHSNYRHIWREVRVITDLQ